ncbi:hypothetical protein T4D_5407 [Trichinella pseudospiralis]|uniref:Uncharacterized protein n=1 Tax=Trichinella pseudospiralis TaxID=6337 RepID=A0A0V1F6K1_TRIPS|nr:hypothetical protein T4D_5407 [Trichinella pseudospiralis]
MNRNTHGEERRQVEKATRSERIAWIESLVGQLRSLVSYVRWSVAFVGQIVSAHSSNLGRGKPRLSALKRWGRGDCAFCLLNRVREGNLPCSLGRWSARFPTLEQGKPRLSALKRWGRGDCVLCLPNRVRESAVFLALWAGRAHASQPWSGESLSFPR